MTGLSNIGISSLFLSVLYCGGTMVATDQLTSGELMSFLVSTQTMQRALGLEPSIDRMVL